MNHWITRGECGTPTYYVSVSPCVSLRRPVADARLSKNVGRVLRALPDLRCSLTRWVRSVRTSPGLISAPDPAHSRPRPSSAGAITTIISRIDCVHVDASVVLGVVVTHARAARRGYVNRCVNDIRRRPSQPLIQWRFHPHTVHRGRRLRSTQGPSDA